MTLALVSLPQSIDARAQRLRASSELISDETVAAIVAAAEAEALRPLKWHCSTLYSPICVRNAVQAVDRSAVVYWGAVHVKTW